MKWVKLRWALNFQSLHHHITNRRETPMPITRINHFSAADGKEVQLQTFLCSLVPYITNCDGNLMCEVLRQHDSDNKFVVIEQWQSIEAHQQSLANFPSDDMQAAMVLFGAPPSGAAYHKVESI